MDLIKVAEEAFATGKQFPEFKSAESPAIDHIEVNKYGKVRRAKLYYLRALTGKKARIAEKRVVTGE